MTIYTVTETITEFNEENAWGYYSSLEKAQQAILKRVAEEYTEEEMKNCYWQYEGTQYITPDTDWVAGCTYDIGEYELDGELA